MGDDKGQLHRGDVLTCIFLVSKAVNVQTVSLLALLCKTNLTCGNSSCANDKEVDVHALQGMDDQNFAQVWKVQ